MFSDRTFESYPKLFYQFSIFHGEKDKNDFHLVVFLLPDKTNINYTQ